MRSTRPDTEPHSRELRRRMHARGRRVKVLRRRVGAVAITLFLLSWAAVYEGGELGRSTTSASAAVPLVAAARSTTSGKTTSTGDADNSSSKGSGSTATSESSSSKQTTATAVTTRQS